MTTIWIITAQNLVNATMEHCATSHPAYVNVKTTLYALILGKKQFLTTYHHII